MACPSASWPKSRCRRHRARAGAAASIAETSSEIGNALGIALFGSLATLAFRLFGPGVADTLNKTLEHPGIAEAAATQAKQAFLSGLHLAMGAGGALMLLMGVAAWVWLPRKLPG